MGCERQYGLFILISPNQRAPANIWPHRPELTRERSIRFLLFEIKCVFVYNSTDFRLTDLFVLYFSIQNVYANKKNIYVKRL